MNKLYYFFSIMFFVLLFLPVVSADLIVNPQSSTQSVTWYTNTVRNMTIQNQNNYSIVNLTFSPVVGFSFPISIDLNPNESRVVSYSIYTNTLFTSQVFVSTLSYFYSVNSSVPVKSYEVNISASGFTSIPTLMSNDSIVWHNLLSSPVILSDLSSGFPTVNIPAGASVSVVYLGVHSYSFYIVQNGITGNFNVVARSNYQFAHDSSSDKQLSFTLSSVLPASTMQVSLLSNNISVDNNVTYLEALIEIRNLDPNLVIQGINVSADHWVSSFSPNSFNLPAGGVQRVLFNVTPYVDRTNLTNRSHKVILSVRSDNAGSTVKDIDVFIKYQNLDVVNIGGNNYTITVLGVNATIEACLQHMNDVGFEKCLDLGKYFTINRTIIKEIPAKITVSEDVAKAGWDSVAKAENIAVRTENKQNLVLDKINVVVSKTDNLSDEYSYFTNYVRVREDDRDKVVQSHNLRFWLCVSFGLFFLLMYFIVGLLSNIELFEAYEKAGQ